ncbi:MAG: alpha/beta hydrolase [Lachnospiraceae bacterium]|nr:alpha/beta hydrolase [Lachnospiraceae bacterium]
MKLIKDIVYGTDAPASQVLDLYLPDTEEADLFIYFHGGGLEAGDKACTLAQNVANLGKAVISANYRMYPNAVFPEFLEDAAMVVNWAKEHMHEYTKINKVFVGGSSAGAWQTAMIAFDPQYLGKHGIKTTDITGYIINSAQMTTHFNVLRERGINTKRIMVDDAAPVYFINENTAFPNIFVIVSDDDMACRLEQNLMFLKTLEMLGCPSEKVTYKLMEGFKHCKYDGNEDFAETLNDYMNSVQ